MQIKKKNKLVCGVGVNDAEFATQRHATINDKRRAVWVCPFYQPWVSMLKRCYCVKYQKNKPTYIGCSVDSEWLMFSNFRSWMMNQDWEGKQLDKDILFLGNKFYSPRHCVFIDRALNVFMTERSASRGEWPIGVAWDTNRSKLIAKINNPFIKKQEYLGRFDNPEKAHQAWKKRKHELALIYADMQTDERIAKALRLRYAQ